MKRILLATVAIAALGSASALAADLPQRPAYKAPMVVPPPALTWTGCYIGGNIGGAFGHARATDNTTGAEGSGNGSGFAGGGPIGCDYQFRGGFLIRFPNNVYRTRDKKNRTFPGQCFAGTIGRSDIQKPT